MGIVYQSTALEGTGKTGIIKPDADGRYDVSLGGLGLDNDNGDSYPDLPEVIALFNRSSNLQRRIQEKYLRSEWGHPKPDGLTPDQFFVRILNLYEERVCNLITHVELEPSTDPRNGKRYTMIRGRVKPYGPAGEYVRQGFEDPDINIAYSIRCISADKRRWDGTKTKVIREIVTWDCVTEPGIGIANKFHTPSMESLMLRDISMETLFQARKRVMGMSHTQESAGVLNMINRIMAIKESDNRAGKIVLPPSARW